MAIRNTFNPERFRGRNGYLTIEESSRLQDLIKGAGDAYARQINQILQQFNVTVTNVTAPAGAQGAMGVPGQDGEDGAPGPPGRQGVDGAAGPQGTTGPRGLNGDDGVDGLDSMVPGPVGARGAQGIMGPPGQDGDTNDVTVLPASSFWVRAPITFTGNTIGLATPNSGRVLAGNSGGTGFDASDEIRIDISLNHLALSSDGSLSMVNGTAIVGSNYDRVRAFWSANVWNLTSEKGGTGTVRSMRIDADTATLTANGDTLTLTATTTMNVGTLATTPAINVLANTSIFIAAGTAITSPHPSASFASSQLLFSTSLPSQAANVATAWDGIRVSGDCSLTGTGTVTTPVSSWTFSVPTITGTGVGATVTDAATVRIVGAPVGSGLTVNLSAALWVQAGATRLEGDLVLPAVANGSVATVLGSLGPAGSHTTVQKWFVWKDTSGTAYYVPGF